MSYAACWRNFHYTHESHCLNMCAGVLSVSLIGIMGFDTRYAHARNRGINCQPLSSLLTDFRTHEQPTPLLLARDEVKSNSTVQHRPSLRQRTCHMTAGLPLLRGHSANRLYAVSCAQSDHTPLLPVYSMLTTMLLPLLAELPLFITYSPVPPLIWS